jgi:hypothetical protein
VIDYLAPPAQSENTLPFSPPLLAFTRCIEGLNDRGPIKYYESGRGRTADDAVRRGL